MFTKERLEELLPVMAAWVSGKRIQVQHIESERNWIDMTLPPRWQDDMQYRIKPEPVMVPFEAKDIRPDWIFKPCEASEGLWTKAVNLSSLVISFGNGQRHNFENLQKCYLYSDDCGATWKRCEKEQS